MRIANTSVASDSLALAQKVLAAQPFNGQIGARITAFGEGAAVLEIDIEHRHLQQYGLVHGGVLAYAADNVLTFAAGSVLGPNVVTAGMTVNYLRPARIGTLRATATVAHHTRKQAVATASIEAIQPDGTVTLCAIAQGTVWATSGER
ncbi:PaaI family thioesterase [Hoyosella subflava]|uniref:Medium/long-chain acyl-CoA thioesterase YigI n=1 Tax=Hoyosella subflava (strain DSM 45089 / JCM 17490 / NBRC 109087 / DQS3-9A1) TaxID=443218 RepID=F6ENU8_HOYSD|nr:PaaI family thioesterase [Hoyosella subflava]AEF42955.1 Thioesterase superfamily protein [Hoyosella subflava DQS3-9A1]